MFLESFRHIIEIEALKRENSLNNQRIKSEEKRISDLDLLRQKAEARLTAIPEEIKSLQLSSKQNNVELLTTRLTKLNQQLQMAQTQKEEETFRSQIDHVTKELTVAEENFFSLLETSEAFEQEQTELKSFLMGSLQTKNDLLIETKNVIDRELKSIEHRMLRVTALTNELHESVKKIYLETEKRMQSKETVAFLQDKKCSACFIQIDSVMKQSLDEGRSIENCPNCSRFLIPESCRI
jgi:predicted  nucleic acid-binding Zn-ribbon protein